MSDAQTKSRNQIHDSFSNVLSHSTQNILFWSNTEEKAEDEEKQNLGKTGTFFLKSTKNKQQSGYMSVHKNQSNDRRNEKINWTSTFRGEQET